MDTGHTPGLLGRWGLKQRFFAKWDCAAWMYSCSVRLSSSSSSCHNSGGYNIKYQIHGSSTIRHGAAKPNCRSAGSRGGCTQCSTPKATGNHHQQVLPPIGTMVPEIGRVWGGGGGIKAEQVYYRLALLGIHTGLTLYEEIVYKALGKSICWWASV